MGRHRPEALRGSDHHFEITVNPNHPLAGTRRHGTKAAAARRTAAARAAEVIREGAAINHAIGFNARIRDALIEQAPVLLPAEWFTTAMQSSPSVNPGPRPWSDPNHDVMADLYEAIPAEWRT